jgi:hypothetical protein
MRQKISRDLGMADGKPRSNPILAWLTLGILLLGLLGLYLAARAGNMPVLLAGLAILVGGFWYFARRGRAYYQAHPEEEAEARRQRAVLAAQVERRDNQRFKQKLLFVGIALTVVAAMNIWRRFAPSLDALPRGERLTWIFLGAVILIVLGNLAWAAWKKKRVNAQP